MACRYGIIDHMKQPSEQTRKITVNLPAYLLDEAMRETGLGVTEVLHSALKEQSQRRAQRAFLELGGKIKFKRSYEEIKADRE